ncbi:GIY-YIG nuclease family protein [Silvibacterium dinghuense]|uniref:GIY-YIG nuclease family protein n=1 Tax=Silvibacterium dinghuense TaxID=1560006 RepID=A0A4Q1S9S3_9BACT|nr:GIY-YIG nuclease family protein [Silvibacterium dinghuense]RXS93803.1 GIY-YIG nuclease family protein [Silvibacterium dinghuense]
MASDRHYFVYLMASRTHVLYCGITNNLERRTYEHQHGLLEGFSSEYHCTRLVWFESFGDVRNAIGREKQIKRWRREKKLALIRKMNPCWVDLSEAWRN